MELSNPFTRQIASSWSKIFEADLFASFEREATAVIQRLLADVEASAAAGLKERAKGQGELCMEEAHVALRKTLEVVGETMDDEQKEVSRCLSPHVKDQLFEAYERAMEERGRGSVARQKVGLFPCSHLTSHDLMAPSMQAVFHGYVARLKDQIFNGAADVIMTRLSKAAEAIGDALKDALNDLARKVRIL